MSALTKGFGASLLSVTLLASLLLAGGPYAGTAHACSCAGTGSTEESFRRADAVFSGEVVDVGQLATPNETTAVTMPYLNPVTFDVGGAWKGVSEDSVIVHGEGAEASCGIDFDRGETYLVFAAHSREAEDSPLQTDFCGATEQVDLESARQMLGPPPATLPETGGIPPEQAERRSNETYAVAAALATLVAGIVFARGMTARDRQR